MVNTPVWHATHGKNASSFDPKLSLRKTTGRLPSYYSYPFAPPRVHNRCSSTKFSNRFHLPFSLCIYTLVTLNSSTIQPLHSSCDEYRRFRLTNIPRAGLCSPVFSPQYLIPPTQSPVLLLVYFLFPSTVFLRNQFILRHGR